MPYADSGGVKIYYEETGAGTPLLFLHEFAGDHRSWVDQVRHFSRSNRCIAMAARGYPPSDVPAADDDYGQDIANRDAVAVLDAAGVERAHVVGLSMGAYTALQLALHFPNRVHAVIAAGGGSGALKASRQQFIDAAMSNAGAMERAARIAAEDMGASAVRVQLQNKDPVGWRRMVEHLAEHPPAGLAKVLRNVPGKRPSLYDLEAALAAVAAPVLLIVGDEDEPCLDVNLHMKRLMPSAQLAMLPGCGHVLNYEEPALFNALIERFLGAVERGTWRPRDPRAAPSLAPGFAAMLGGKAD